MRQLTIIFFGLAIFFIISCEQGKIQTPANAMDKFEAFKSKEKFTPDTTIFYPGIADSTMRPILTEKINSAATDFKKLAEKGDATAKDYQDKIQVGLDRFSDVYINLDTEDRERVCHYFEELMDVVGLESSGGHLNHFLYGFTPSKKK